MINKTMKDQLISFETAILAKEKGFNIESNNQKGYNAEGNLEMCSYSLYVNNEDFNETGLLSAPTQSLLAKWLREVHKIYITIHYNKSGRFNVSIEDECENSLGIAIFGEYFNSYEQALEEGLTQALKLL